MMRRFRMVAGPNGSGKSTLMRRLQDDYAVNFYDVLNADEIFAEVGRTGCYSPRIPVDEQSLRNYAIGTEYPSEIKSAFVDGRILVRDDCVRFASAEVVNSYTIALLTNFLQHEFIVQGKSFSQETVFSHPSKIEALKVARESGYRTYLYFVTTSCPEINLARVANRVAQGGHAVPDEKIVLRYQRSMRQLTLALPYLSRLFIFDNSREAMCYVGEWNRETGFKAVDGIVVPSCYAELIGCFSTFR